MPARKAYARRVLRGFLLINPRSGRGSGDSTAEATLNLYWTARPLSGEPEAADDVDDLRWFAADELPTEDELAFENVPLVLAAWRDEHP